MTTSHRIDDPHTFADRTSAGLALAARLHAKHLHLPILTLALPRGGVPVAYEVARVLGTPLDVLAVRKIGMPGQPEFAIGAIAAGGITVRDSALARELEMANPDFEHLVRREKMELARREQLYRGDAPPLDLSGRIAILVDDGLATGLTMLAAIRSARQANAARVIVAVPVASRDACAMLAREADDLLALVVPDQLRSIGEWYESFEQVEDEEVLSWLRLANPASQPGKRASLTTARPPSSLE